MNKKQTYLLLGLFILIFIILTVSAAFAFFAIVPINKEKAERKATSATMPILVFNAGDGINIRANSYNFGKDMPSLIDDTTSTVTLTAGSDKFAQAKYNVKLKLEKNDFIYTTPNEDPELLLIITDYQNNPIKHIDGLEYKTVLNYEGFDITGKEGEYNIALDQVITATDTTTHAWNIKVMFINYSSVQDANGSKTLGGYFILENAEVLDGNI